MDKSRPSPALRRLNKCDRPTIEAFRCATANSPPCLPFASRRPALDVDGRCGRPRGHRSAGVPDGRPELILHFGDRFHRVIRTARLPAGDHFRGPVDGTADAPADRSDPGARHPLSSRSGSRIGPRALEPPLGLHARRLGCVAPLAAALARVRDSTDDPAVAVPLVQLELMRLLDVSRIDARVRHAVAAIERHRGQVSITRLASELSCSRRHLERGFLDAVGVGPKRLARIARFQHALQLIEHADISPPRHRDRGRLRLRRPGALHP